MADAGAAEPGVVGEGAFPAGEEFVGEAGGAEFAGGEEVAAEFAVGEVGEGGGAEDEVEAGLGVGGTAAVDEVEVGFGGSVGGETWEGGDAGEGSGGHVEEDGLGGEEGGGRGGVGVEGAFAEDGGGVGEQGFAMDGPGLLEVIEGGGGVGFAVGEEAAEGGEAGFDAGFEARESGHAGEAAGGGGGVQETADEGEVEGLGLEQFGEAGRHGAFVEVDLDVEDGVAFAEELDDGIEEIERLGVQGLAEWGQCLASGFGLAVAGELEGVGEGGGGILGVETTDHLDMGVEGLALAHEHLEAEGVAVSAVVERISAEGFLEELECEGGVGGQNPLGESVFDGVETDPEGFLDVAGAGVDGVRSEEFEFPEAEGEQRALG